MFEAVLFDNDGILIDTERLFVRACQEMLEEMYGEILDLEMYQEYGYTLGTGTTGWLLEKGYSKEEIITYQKQRDTRYEKFLSEGVSPMKGVRDLLEFLQKNEIPRAIVTAARRVHLEFAHSQTGLLDCFSFAITTEDVSKTKPSPEAYLQAAKKLNISPEKCLVIEDSPRGVEAGKAAGMTVWSVPTDQTIHLDLSKADEVFGSMVEVLERLR